MQIFRSLADIPAKFGPSVVTIGNFDGVHRGHQAVIADVIARARMLGARAIAVTFDPHPVRVLRPQVQFGVRRKIDGRHGILRAVTAPVRRCRLDGKRPAEQMPRPRHIARGNGGARRAA